jgi:hypothetical protein
MLLGVRTGRRVVSGSFQGMKFNLPNFNTAMLLGTWEKELFQVIEVIKNSSYSKILCIGAAEGYYAVGLGLNHKDTPVIAFEEIPEYRSFLQNLAESNRLKNIRFKKRCNRENLKDSLDSDTGRCSLIFCDIEGGEIELLNPEKITSLRNSHILVEIHEMYQTNCEKTLIERFSNTHQIQIVKGQERTVTDLPPRLSFLNYICSQDKILSFMSEGRPYPMNWLWLTPKTSEA